MPAPTVQRLLEPPFTRERFQAQLRAIMGYSALLWMPRETDTATSTTDDTVGESVVTWDASVAARHAPLEPRGAVSQSFTLAGAQKGTIPDANKFSFGTGAADLPFSGVVLANVTDTAAIRVLVAKWNGVGNREWEFLITATDGLQLVLFDESAGVSASRLSDAVITQGSWHLFGWSYVPSIGTTAADGITLYQDGAVIASTATNNASYVAMENLASTVAIGAASNGSNLDGSLALEAVCTKNLTAGDHNALSLLCRRFFGLP